MAGNTGLLSRLDAFLQEAGKASDAPGGAPAEKLELEDDCDGEHIELDMSCGVFDLKNDEAVRAAEAAVRSGGGGGGGGGGRRGTATRPGTGTGSATAARRGAGRGER